MKNVVLLSIAAFTASVFADAEVATVSEESVVATVSEEGMVADCNAKPACKPKPKPACKAKPVCKPKPKPACKPKPKPCVATCKPKPKPKCEPCVIKPVNPVVLTSAAPCADAGVYFFGDALYWYTDVGNTDWSSVSSSGSSEGEHLQWKWNWGFRVGIGFDMDHDQWDTNFYYTWFHGKTSNSSNGASVNVTAPAVALDNLGELGVFTAGSAKGKLNFNVGDWELGRWFYVSQSISLRPHVGIRGGWIKLKQEETYTSGGLFTPASIEDKTKFWGVGPTVGLNTSWWFGNANSHHWSIFGDFGGGLLFGQIKNKFDNPFTFVGVASDFNVNTRKVNTAIPVLNAIMGLGWDTCFGCNKRHFGIRLGYELQYWFRLSQRLVNFDSVSYFRLIDNLSLQGMTLDFRFDF